LEALGKKVSDKMREMIGINVPLTVAPFNSIPRSEGKAKRVIDERPK